MATQWGKAIITIRKQGGNTAVKRKYVCVVCGKTVVDIKTPLGWVLRTVGSETVGYVCEGCKTIRINVEYY